MYKCRECSEVKPQSEFYRDARAVSGFRTDCKVCTSARSARNYVKNRESILRKQRE